MDDKLFQAILAMDSYSRGNNARILFGPDKENSEASDGLTQIGEATVFLSANSDIGQSVGFYAISYKLADNSVVVAYRGTDEQIQPLAKDVLFSYAIGMGIPNPTQGELAFDFYQDTVLKLKNAYIWGHYT